jgi:hypothetical protein
VSRSGYPLGVITAQQAARSAKKWNRRLDQVAGSSAAQATLSFFADQTGAPLYLPLSFPQSGAGTTTVASSVAQTLAAGQHCWLQVVDRRSSLLARHNSAPPEAGTPRARPRQSARAAAKITSCVIIGSALLLWKPAFETTPRAML